MPRGIFFNEFFDGHINPSLPVVQELVARGDEIIYYVGDAFQQQVERTGATFRSITRTLDNATLDASQITSSILFSIGATPTIRPILASDEPGDTPSRDDSEAILAVLLADARAAEPDYVLYDSCCLYGRLLAQRLDLPAVVVHTTYVDATAMNVSLPGTMGATPEHEQDSGFDPFPAIDGALPFPVPPFDPFVQPFIPGAMQLGSQDQATLNIVCIPRFFQPQQEHFNEQFVFVGPSIMPRDDIGDFPIEQIDPDTTLLIALGTLFSNQADFYRVCFAAFGNTSWQVILAVGQEIDLEELGPVPANFLLRRRVPQLDVLQRTNVFVTHGGMNSVMEALYYGVPMVVIPQQHEQAVTAQSIAALEIGIALDRETLTAAQLREAVDRVATNQAFRASAQKVQRDVRAAGGYAAAATAILEFVASSH